MIPSRPRIRLPSRSTHLSAVLPKHCYACTQDNCTGLWTCTCNCHEKRRVAANEILKALETPKCKAHPRYQALRKPRANCEQCWRKYVFLNPR